MAKQQKRKTQSIPKDESKTDRFIRVVTPRVNKAIKAIKQIGYCAGASYEYTPQQAARITTELLNTVEGLGDTLGKTKKAEDEFSLTD